MGNLEAFNDMKLQNFGVKFIRLGLQGMSGMVWENLG